MNVPGEQEYRNKGVAYCPHCDGLLFKGKKTAVIGGGNSGIEAAIDLAGIFIQIGLMPNSEWLKRSKVALSPQGKIEIDVRGATSIKAYLDRKYSSPTTFINTSLMKHQIFFKRQVTK